MRRIFLLVLTVFSIGLVSAPAWADDATTSDISDSQADTIRQNCKQAQSVLQRLQTTDVATRINRGHIYEDLLNRLITPFDSRVSLNHYDVSTLSSTAGAISQGFNSFKNDYSTYEDSFSKLLSDNCEADPRGFYDLLTTTRDERSTVASDVATLDTLISQYTSSFTSLKTSIEGAS